MSEDLNARDKSTPNARLVNQMGTAKFLNEYFNYLDKDKDSFVTENELLQATTESKFMSEHAKEMKDLVNSKEIIRRQSFDFYWCTDNPSISRNDANSYRDGLTELNQQLNAADYVCKSLPELFINIDSNKDGTIGKEELDTYCASNRLEKEHFVGNYLKNNLEFVGHETSRSTSVSYMPMYIGKNITLHPVYKTTYAYGVSRDDMTQLPQKIKGTGNHRWLLEP